MTSNEAGIDYIILLQPYTSIDLNAGNLLIVLRHANMCLVVYNCTRQTGYK